MPTSAKAQVRWSRLSCAIQHWNRRVAYRPGRHCHRIQRPVRCSGGFVGYNWQWSELVVGWDLAYKRPASLNSTASDSLRRLFDTSDSVRHDVTIDAQASFKLVDYATL